MRLLPLLTALLVAGTLYIVIFERDMLFEFAGAERAQPAVETEAAAVEQPALPAVSVVAIRSEAREIENAIVLRGTTEAGRRLEVRAEVTGLVITEPIRRGTRVASGDLLCELDPGARVAQLAQARAELEEARMNENASSRLAERGYASETQAMSRIAQLQAAQARVDQAEREVARLQIYAPFDGVLEDDTAELGTLLMPGSTCGTLLALDTIRLVGFVPEQDVDRVAIGSLAGARLLSGRQVAGRVTFVASSADPVTRTFEVEIEVPNPDFSIRVGATVEIYIGLAGGKAHLLPQTALTLDDLGRPGVRVAEGGVARFVPIDIVRDDADGLWVTGLPNRADVIVVGQEFVRDGRTIQVTYSGDG
ncbi:MAG: efflux RND transporter periplasmic adaptor subunit [Pseudomonadota bacterium]